MALNLTEEAKDKASQIQKTPNLIVEIDGLENNLSFVPSEKTLRFDDDYNYDDVGLFFDSAVLDNKNDPFIMAKGGSTTKQLTQQLNQDKGGSSSVQSLTISVVDENQKISSQLSQIEVLGTRAKAYLTFQGLEHPQNSSKIFDGSIDKFLVDAGRVDLVIRNPEALKRQDIFPLFQTNLSSNINASTTTIPVNFTDGFLLSQDAVTSYIRIEDELIQVGGVSGNNFINCTRGAKGTSLSSHDADEEISSVYRFRENSVDLALKLMLSGSDFVNEMPIFSIVTTPDGDIQNAIVYDDVNIEESEGLVTGDFVQITESSFNNGTYEIIGFGTTTTNQSYVLVNSNLVTENDIEADVFSKFKSKYDVLADGLGMFGNEIDITQHIFIKEQFLTTAPDLDIDQEETINAKEFIERELYFPVGAYTLARKGRASVGYTAPAVIQADSTTLNSSNILNATKIKVLRSINKNFYNSVVYRYERDIIANKFLANRIRVSGKSLSEIRGGNKPLKIDTRGFRQLTSEAFIDTTSRRLLDRYELGARTIKIETNWETGYQLELGDTVRFDGRDMQIYDELTGLRDTFERVMEITNLSKSITTGQVSAELVDTNFSATGRYASYSPSSIIAQGSTVDRVRLKRSFGVSAIELESDKWTDYIGLSVSIIDDSFTIIDTGVIEGLDTSLANTLIVSGLTIIPQENNVLEFVNYDSQGSTQKLLHGCFTPSVQVTSGISQTEFTVADSSKFFVGALIEIVNESFTQLSEELTVETIIGNNITVNNPIGFTPNSNNTVEGIGFVSDEGDRYLWY